MTDRDEALFDARSYLRGREYGGPGTAELDRICRTLLAEHARAEAMRGVVAVAARVVSRGMQHREPNRDTLLVNDVLILGMLEDAIDALRSGAGRGE